MRPDEAKQFIKLIRELSMLTIDSYQFSDLLLLRKYGKQWYAYDNDLIMVLTLVRGTVVLFHDQNEISRVVAKQIPIAAIETDLQPFRELHPSPEPERLTRRSGFYGLTNIVDDEVNIISAQTLELNNYNTAYRMVMQDDLTTSQTSEE